MRLGWRFPHVASEDCAKTKRTRRLRAGGRVPRAPQQASRPAMTLEFARSLGFNEGQFYSMFRSNSKHIPFRVMAGLVPAIHAFAAPRGREEVDARDERGLDGGERDAIRTKIRSNKRQARSAREGGLQRLQLLQALAGLVARRLIGGVLDVLHRVLDLRRQGSRDRTRRHRVACLREHRQTVGIDLGKAAAAPRSAAGARRP